MRTLRWIRQEFTFVGLLLIPAALVAVAAFAGLVMLFTSDDGEQRPADSVTPTGSATPWECARDPETGDVADCWVLHEP